MVTDRIPWYPVGAVGAKWASESEKWGASKNAILFTKSRANSSSLPVPSKNDAYNQTFQFHDL